MSNYKIVRHKKSKVHHISNGLLAIGVALLITGLSVGYRDMLANDLANKQAAELIGAANRRAAKLLTQTATISSTTVPATIKPAVAAVTGYTVAPNFPRYLMIPKLGVNARILAVGVDAQGALETPSNVFDTAWFNESSLPGQTGAMLIDGHVSSWTAHGVFHDLKKLIAGDIINIERGDNTLFNYKVVKVQVYDADSVDMIAATKPVDVTKPGLNLISCTGDVIAGTNEFNKRIIVFATQI